MATVNSSVTRLTKDHGGGGGGQITPVNPHVAARVANHVVSDVAKRGLKKGAEPAVNAAKKAAANAARDSYESARTTASRVGSYNSNAGVRSLMSGLTGGSAP